MQNENQNDAILENLRTAYKEYEQICAVLAKSCGLSEAEYWILLMVRDGCVTQRDICEQLFISKQTVNSASMQLVKKGLIRTETLENNLRTKHILLTEAGIRFAEENVDTLSKAEERAWNVLSEDEQLMLINLTRKFNNLMKSELRDCIKTK